MAKKDSRSSVTIYDLAQELDVSPSTVSRALNDHKGIGKKTKKAVKKLAKKRGYRPNNFAYALRTNRSNTIGIMVSWINRHFISSLIAGIEAAAKEAGYNVIIIQTHDNLDLEIETLQTLIESRISALIVSLAMETDTYDHFSILGDYDIPVVYVDRIPRMKNGHKVHIDNFRAGFEATQHLIKQGCNRIAHLGGSRNQLIYEDRRRGYIAALAEHSFEIDDTIIMEAYYLSDEEGLRHSETLLNLDSPPDGIFCANDTTAVNAIKYAKSKGIKIPDELAIIGFNDDPVCQIVEPQLSSVIHPAMEMGEKAVKEVLAILDESKGLGSPHGVTLDTQVIVRSSSNRRRS